ncbi:hypothetical protein HK102_007716, partial [Quaeritorhiza haematococci]
MDEATTFCTNTPNDPCCQNVQPSPHRSLKNGTTTASNVPPDAAPSVDSANSTTGILGFFKSSNGLYVIAGVGVLFVVIVGGAFGLFA